MKLVLLLTTTALAASSSGCTSPVHALEKGPELQAVPVRLGRVDPGPVERPIHAAGVVVAKDERELSFKVGGMIARVLVDAGAGIRRGQLLATLDSTELEAGVAQARAALAKARRDAARAALLAAADSAPVAAAEDSRTALAVAEATLEAAEFNLRHAALFAPDDGWVDLRQAEPGEVVGPGRPILHVSGVSRGMVVRASLADRDVLELAPGAPAEVRLDARPEVVLAGRVTEIARSAARGTGTWQIEVAVALGPVAGGSLAVSGLTAKLTLPRRVAVAGTVPVSALVDGDGDEGAVYIVEGGRARRRPVHIAFLAGERVALASGLEGVTSVVADGAASLSDGAAVRVGE